MQESFHEKRRANALRSNPTGGLRAIALVLVVAVLAAVVQSLRQPRPVPSAQPDQTPGLAGSGAGAQDSPAESATGYAPTDPRADKLEALVFESFGASGKKGVQLEAKGSSGRETERRFLDTVKARIPFVTQGRQAILEIVADHAEHVASRPSALFKGHVKMTTDDGLVLETDELFYDGRDGRAQSERKVVWHRKDLAGEALGMLYEGWSDSLTFFKEVKIRLRDPDDPPADIEANSACLSRSPDTLFLEGDVRVDQGGNRTRSGSLALFFGAERALYRALFRDGFELVAQGDTAALGFSFPRAGGRKTISGRRLDMTFGEGRALEEVAAGPEAVMIVEPGPTDPAERREIRGEALIFKFGPNGKLREYLGNSGTSVRFVPLVPSAGDLRTISSTDFVATLDPSTGEAETISFIENVVFERRSQRGKGRKAEFSEKTARMLVSGGVSFEDSTTRVSLTSESIDIDTRVGSFRATGGVRHVQKGGLPGAPFGTAGSELLATSGQVVYDAPRKTTRYLERVVFRSGSDQLRALAIETIETPAGPKITADTGVEILVSAGATGPLLDARSDRMIYTPLGRSFDFLGSALVRRTDFETRAPQIVVGLGPVGSFEIRTLEAQGGLVAIRSGERTASGTHLLFTPRDGKVKMAGAPVKLEDQGRRVQGRSVTFFTSGDRVEVVGEEGRTETVLQRKIKKP